MSGQRMTKTNTGEGMLRSYDNWNARGDLGLDPRAEKFLLQRTSRKDYGWNPNKTCRLDNNNNN